MGCIWRRFRRLWPEGGSRTGGGKIFERGYVNFDVELNPKISISIPVARPKSPRDTTKIIDFEMLGQFFPRLRRALFSMYVSPGAAAEEERNQALGDSFL